MRLEGRPILDLDLNLTNAGQSPIVMQVAAFFVGPPGTIDISTLDALGSLRDGDKLLVERDGEQHSFEAEDMKEFLGLPVVISDTFNNEHEL